MGPNVRDLFCQGEKSDLITFKAQPITRNSRLETRNP